MSRLLKSLLLWSLIVLFVLVGSVSGQDSEEPQTPTNLEMIVGYNSDLPPNPNCSVPIPFLNGQGYAISGVGGGLTVDKPPGTTIHDPLSFMVDPATPTPISTNVTEDTAILVIDSFGNPTASSPNPYWLNHAINSRNIIDDGRLEAAYVFGILPHGVLVFNHISALLQGRLGPSRSASDVSVEWNDPSSGFRVALFEVDALDYENPTSTTLVAQKLTDALAAAVSAGYTRIILNMSFAILPCDITTDYLIHSGRLSFDEYLKSIGRSTKLDYEQALITPTAAFADPVQAVIGQCGQEEEPKGDGQSSSKQDIESLCPSGQVTAIFVGSAGNSHLPYPFYPAAFDKVISVSASQDDNLVDYSNYMADTRLTGGWFTLDAYTAADPSTLVPVNPTIYYRGTSFSGPVKSVCLALNVADTVYPCISVSPP